MSNAISPPASPAPSLPPARRPDDWQPATQPKNGLRIIALILAAIGAYLSFDLIRLGSGLSATNPLLSAVCSASGPSDCATVLGSDWAYMNLAGTKPDNQSSEKRSQAGGPRIPLSAFGLGYFLALGAWWFFIGPPGRGRGATNILLVLFNLAGVLQSAYSTAIMAYVLHRWCMGCVAVHVVNALLFLLAIAAFPWSSKTPEMRPPHPTHRLVGATFIAGTLLLLVPPLFMLMMYFNNVAGQLTTLYRGLMDDPAFVKWDYERQAPVQLPAEGEYDGPDDAANTVVAFVDFECPLCQKLHGILRKLQADYPGLVRVQYRHYPLDSACNPAVRKAFHPAACAAARACEAAGIAGGPAAKARYRDFLYDQQEKLQLGEFSTWASGLQIDVAKFEAALAGKEPEERIKRDMEIGRSLGLKDAIPAVYLNGKRFMYWQQPDIWKALLGVPATASTRAVEARSEQ